MPSRLDDLQAFRTKAGAKCAICRWLNALPDSDAESWRPVFAASVDDAPHTAVVAYLEAEGHDFTVHQVTNHRREHAWKNREQA